MRSAAVDFLGLADHNCVVFQVVEYRQLSDLVVLESALDDALLKESEESENLQQIMNKPENI